MRASVRKARVGTIWKLTKESKLLKNRKHGEEKILQKCKKKSERLIKEIKALKKLKDDDITKFAVLNTRGLQEVLTDPKSNAQTRVMIKLAFHKLLKSSVQSFKEKFPHYKLGKRQLTKAELKKSLGLETLPEYQQINSQKSDEELNTEDEGKSSENEHENSLEEEETSLNHSDDSNDENSDVEPPEKEECLKPKQKKSKLEKKSKKLNSKKSTSSSISSKGKKSPEKSKKIKVVSNLVAVKRLKIGQSLEETEEQLEPLNPPTREKKKELETEIDSFFISASGESVYKSVIVPKLHSSMINEEENEENEFERQFSRKQKNSFNRRDEYHSNRVDRNRQSNFVKNRGDFSKERGEFQKDRTSFKRDNKFESYKEKDKIKDSKNEENLHPSWAARKKQQEALKQGFQGKKIVFSDD